MTETELITAYRRTAQHRVEVLRSATCGCIHCLALFETSEIKHWIDTGQTAVCPRCGIDAVIGSDSGLDLSEEFLIAMQDRWFRKLKTA
jgi:hypothetical protein